MPLPLPNLDDRDFRQLVAEARQRILQSCPEWTDLSPSDPGVVLLELFAYLTDTMLYRLNRLPEKAYIAFLRLLGVSLLPPAAASATLRFRRSNPTDQPVTIPLGTRVTLGRANGGETPSFVTSYEVTLSPAQDEVDVLAYHAEWIKSELVAIGTGQPGLSVQLQRPPVVAPTGDRHDLVVAVEVDAGEENRQFPALKLNGKVYRIWREAANFADSGAEDHIYLVDRTTGVIRFAPAVRSLRTEGGLEEIPRPLAAVPGEGREIRAWYLRGGGPAGNVSAGSLTALKDPVPGVQVSNPQRASGGRSAETLENALARGPQDLHALQRAVTAQDFENVAHYSSQAIARAKAVTRAQLWAFAPPGTVEVLLVPHVSEGETEAGRVAASMLRERESEEVRSQIQAALDERRPLGTTCLVSWAHYKTVMVKARIVLVAEEDHEAVRQRVLDRLYQTINPLPTAASKTGWPFGQALHVSNVYDIALKEPGVRRAEEVRLLVDEVPNRLVASIDADLHQKHTWYACSQSRLFRSLNDGQGWELVRSFPDEERVEFAQVHPERPGLLAMLTRPGQADESVLYLSRDAGETWEGPPRPFAFHVEDAAWTTRDGDPLLLLATDRGLFELDIEGDGGPVQVLVRRDEERGFYAVAAVREPQGVESVAVAAQDLGGVYLSNEAGRPGTFRHTGLSGEDIRELAVQQVGARFYLWAGSAAAGDEPGKGCFRWELRGVETPPEGWQPFQAGWNGGTCWSMAFLGTGVLAATHRSGVMRLDSSRGDASWEALNVNCGLPLRDPGRFQPVDAIAADPRSGLVIAGGVEGVFSSRNEGRSYVSASTREFDDKVTIPGTWLIVSGEHEVEVVDEGT